MTASSQTAPPEAAFFGSQGLFGMYHRPVGDPRPCGVVLCPPLGYEAICTHRALRHLAERLANAGFPTLRFDYHGTGDSAGTDRDPARVRAWIDSVHAAAEELRARSGVLSISLFGVRLGATLALAAAGERTDVVCAVLWAPCTSGRAYLREARAFRAMGAAATPQEAGGDEEIVGFVLTRETTDALGALTALEIKTPLPPSVLLLGRDQLAPDEKLVRHLTAAGSKVEARPSTGFAGMMLDTHESPLPAQTLDEITTWLSGIHPARAPATTVTRALPVAGPVAPGVTEEPVWFGPDGRLFGILTQPAARKSRTAIVITNTGANHRIGSCRASVLLARHWAALGFAVFRFDFAGIGDSAVRPGASEQATYTLSTVSDLEAASRFLHSRGFDSEALVGTCAGAFATYHALFALSDVKLAVMINPQAFESTEHIRFAAANAAGAPDPAPGGGGIGYRDLTYYRRVAMDPERWRRLIRGEISFRTHAGVFVRRVRSLAAKGRARLAGKRGATARLGAMGEAGTAFAFIVGDKDAARDLLAAEFGKNLEALQPHGRFQLDIVEGADHTFTGLAAQRRLEEIITTMLQRELRD